MYCDMENSLLLCADAIDKEAKHKSKAFFLTKAQKKEQAEARAAEAAKEASRRALEELQAHKRSMAQVCHAWTTCKQYRSCSEPWLESAACVPG